MNDQLVELMKCWDPTEAHIIRGLLESHDILCFVFDDGIGGLQWHMQVAYNGTRIMVMRSDVERARKILAERQPIQVPDHEKIYFLKPKIWEQCIQLLIFLLTFVPIPWHRLKKSRQDQSPLSTDKN